MFSSAPTSNHVSHISTSILELPTSQCLQRRSSTLLNLSNNTRSTTRSSHQIRKTVERTRALRIRRRRLTVLFLLRRLSLCILRKRSLSLSLYVLGRRRSSRSVCGNGCRRACFCDGGLVGFEDLSGRGVERGEGRRFRGRRGGARWLGIGVERWWTEWTFFWGRSNVVQSDGLTV